MSEQLQPLFKPNLYRHQINIFILITRDKNIIFSQSLSFYSFMASSKLFPFYMLCCWKTPLSGSPLLGLGFFDIQFLSIFLLPFVSG